MKINENSTAGGTSSSNIASTPGGLNFSLQRRLPNTNIFGASISVTNSKQKTKNRGKKI